MYLKFLINDEEYLKEKWRREHIPETNISNLLALAEASKFEGCLSMYGRKNKLPTKIKITDLEGRELSIKTCTSYQMSIIDGCIKYFKTPDKFTRLPFGVIDMTDNIKYIRKAV